MYSKGELEFIEIIKRAKTNSKVIDFRAEFMPDNFYLNKEKRLTS
jgi:hypothetical protein